MKKIQLLCLLIFSAASIGQTTLTNKLKITNDTKSNEANRILVQDSITKEVHWVLKSSVSNKTNLNYIASPIKGTLSNSNGTGVVIPIADDVNAGLLKPVKFTLLERMTEAFTTGLRTLYDNTAEWVTSNGAGLISHLTNRSNPHQVTAEQVGAPNGNGTSTGNNSGDNSINTLYSGLVTNRPTSLSTGTVTGTYYGITSDGDVNDLLIAEANQTQAGVLGVGKWTEIVANTAKVSNITHTGDVVDAGGVLKVTKINNTELSSLSTGILKNSTSTGVPSIAIAGTDYALPNANTTGTASTITGNISESQVTNLTSSLGNKQDNITLTTTGTSGAATLTGSTLNIPSYVAGGGGTVSDVSIVSANGVSGTVATSTTTPAISLTLGAITPTSTNGVTATTMSYVDPTSSIQTQLNGKQPTLGFTPYNSTNPSGYTSNAGTVTNVSSLTLGTTGIDLSSSVATGTTTPVITLNVPTASASNRGALNSTDWSTFNGKQDEISLTTTGTSGAATLVGSVINIPNYATASGTTETASNGLTKTVNDIELGGTLTQNTNIAAGTYELTTTGSTSNTLSKFTNTNNGIALWGDATSGTGVIGTATTGAGGSFGATTGNGIETYSGSGFGIDASSNNYAGFFNRTLVGAASGSQPVTRNILITSTASGSDTASNGIDFSSNVSDEGTVQSQGSLDYRWTDRNSLTYTSAFDVKTVDNTVTNTTLTSKANGDLELPFYGSGSKTGTATYALAVDSAGKVIETAVGGGGGGLSGTVNNLVKFGTTTTGVDSQITDDGTSVKIAGGTGGVEKLQVNGAANISSVITAGGLSLNTDKPITLEGSDNATFSISSISGSPFGQDVLAIGAGASKIYLSEDSGNLILPARVLVNGGTGGAESLQVNGKVNVSFTGSGEGLYVSGNDGNGIQVSLSGSGNAFNGYSVGAIGGIFQSSSSGNYALIGQNLGTGPAFKANIATGSTSNIADFTLNHVTKASVNYLGDITGNKFIKTGATADDVLLGNGTTTSLAGIGGGGAADLAYVPAATSGAVTNTNGTGFTIPAGGTNAGLLINGAQTFYGPKHWDKSAYYQTYRDVSNVSTGIFSYYPRKFQWAIDDFKYVFTVEQGTAFFAKTAATGIGLNLDTNLLTAARTQQVPDKNGTFAMLSDITGGGGGLSGTVNKLVKFGTTTTGVDSQISDDGTSVKINGGTGGAEKLQVNGSIVSTSLSTNHAISASSVNGDALKAESFGTGTALRVYSPNSYGGLIQNREATLPAAYALNYNAGPAFWAGSGTGFTGNIAEFRLNFAPVATIDYLGGIAGSSLKINGGTGGTEILQVNGTAKLATTGVTTLSVTNQHSDAIKGETTGGGAGVFGSSVEGYGGSFKTDAAGTYSALLAVNYGAGNGSAFRANVQGNGDIAIFQQGFVTKSTIDNTGTFNGQAVKINGGTGGSEKLQVNGFTKMSNTGGGETLYVSGDNGNGIQAYISGGGTAIQGYSAGWTGGILTSASSGAYGGIAQNVGGGSAFRASNSSGTSNIADFVFNGTTVANVNYQGNVTGAKLITTGGLASQYVKGDGTLSAGYKVYTALLTQTGTAAPTAIVLENTLGGTVLWTRATNGVYVGTLSSAFTTNKTVVFCTKDTTSPTGTAGVMIRASWGSASTVGISVLNNVGGIDGQLANTSIEIRVYN